MTALHPSSSSQQAWSSLGPMWALQSGPWGLNRAVWTARAAFTRFLISAEDSPVGRAESSPNSRGGTST